MNTKFQKFLYLFLPIILGSIVGIIINPSIDYESLIQPPLAPPKILFPIAWSIIYLLMGISFYLYKKKDDNRTLNITYYLQLIVNLLWSIIFFILKWRFISILWIILLIFLVILTMYLFFKIEKKATYLFIPYLAWLLFATYLNIGIYILN